MVPEFDEGERGGYSGVISSAILIVNSEIRYLEPTLKTITHTLT